MILIFFILYELWDSLKQIVLKPRIQLNNLDLFEL